MDSRQPARRDSAAPDWAHAGRRHADRSTIWSRCGHPRHQRQVAIIDPNYNVVGHDVVIAVDNSDLERVPGMTAFHPNRDRFACRKNMLRVPMGAVRCAGRAADVHDGEHPEAERRACGYCATARRSPCLLSPASMTVISQIF